MPWCFETVSNRRRPHNTPWYRGQTTLARETTIGVDGRHSCMSPRSAPALGLDLLRQNEPFRSPLDQREWPNRNAGTRFRMSSCKQKVQWLPRNAEHSLRADRLSCCWWKSDSFRASNPIDNGILLNDIQYQLVPDFNHHKAMLSWLNDVFTLRIPNCVGPPALVAPLAQRASRWPAESDGFL